ncbi:nucleotide exchange factor GrpE [bacterium]|nr:nucleotide exchange factor GrpE [bacterium]
MKKHKKQEVSNNPFSENEIEEEVKTEEVQDKSNEDAAKIKEDFENLNNQYIRLAADFDNYRKRQAQERESLIAYGAEESMKKLIEVLDNFDRAKTAIDKAEDVQQVKDSFYVLYNQMFENLSKLGLEVIKAQGEEFNPNVHEAVMRTPTNDVEENHVIMELQKGYKFHDKVLRASLVNVAAQE